MSSVSDLEKTILEEGRRLRAAIEEDVLKIRKSKLAEELKAVEAELAKFARNLAGRVDEPTPEPAKAPKSAKGKGVKDA